MYILREIERNDIKIINEWRRDKTLQSFLGGGFRFINEDVDIEWYERYLRVRNNNIRCAIVDKDKNELVGVCYLLDINFVNRSAEIHIMIGDKNNRGRGAGTFAMVEMLKHGFFDLNLERIELEVLESNEKAYDLYKKLGFKKEGTKRHAVFKNGEFFNVFFMSLLREEFKFESII
ncbi:MAG: GNAT family N-acetyltransferase [Bacilli bacterium]|nr:GNAT family N-acetyltransferase [Bacilli bacterium]